MQQARRVEDFLAVHGGFACLGRLDNVHGSAPCRWPAVYPGGGDAECGALVLGQPLNISSCRSSDTSRVRRRRPLPWGIPQHEWSTRCPLDSLPCHDPHRRKYFARSTCREILGVFNIGKGIVSELGRGISNHFMHHLRGGTWTWRQ